MSLHVHINNKDIKVNITKRKGIKNIKITWKHNHELHLSLPWHVSLQEGKKFLDQAHGWLSQKESEQPEKISFNNGTTLPILGQNYKLQHVETKRRRVFFEDQHLIVESSLDLMIPTLKSFLKAELHRFCTKHSDTYANLLGVTISNIKIRPMFTRWGSCSTRSDLSYAYHLVFAPHSVVQYVCAHEVAHLLEMNHSEAYWKQVQKLYPDYKNARNWLKQEGKKLFAHP